MQGPLANRCLMSKALFIETSAFVRWVDGLAFSGVILSIAMGRSLLSLAGCIGIIASIAYPAWGLPSLSTSSTAMTTHLDLDGEGTATTHIVKVADITISTDSATGLILYVTSGSLAKVDGADIDFQVTTVEDEAIAPSHGDFTVFSGNTYTYVTPAATAESRDVYIRYTPNPLQDPGSYSALIQLSVADN